MIPLVEATTRCKKEKQWGVITKLVTENTLKESRFPSATLSESILRSISDRTISKLASHHRKDPASLTFWPSKLYWQIVSSINSNSSYSSILPGKPPPKDNSQLIVRPRLVG